MSEDTSDGHFSEFIDFLTIEARADIRKTAVEYLEGLSSSVNGIRLFRQDDFIVGRQLSIIFVHFESERGAILRILTNICADSASECPRFVIENCEYIISTAISTCKSFASAVSLTNVDHKNVEISAKFLSNLSLIHPHCVWEKIQCHWSDFVKDTAGILCRDEDTKDQSVDYMGYVLRNLTTVSSVRSQLVDSNFPLIHILPLINQTRWLKRKAVAIHILKNLSFEDRLHANLAAHDDVLVAILMPLIGPEELSAGENDCLPMDLQFMEPTKVREGDLDMRICLVQTLYQLCSTKVGRECLRAKGTYYVLREYHKWETNSEANRLISGVIGVLIRTEHEMNLEEGENLREFQEPT